MPIFAVKKSFVVEVTQLVPADTDDLAENRLSKVVKDSVMEALLAKGFVVSIEGTDCEVVDLDKDVFRLKKRKNKMADNNNSKVYVGTITVSGKVFKPAELRESGKGNKFATFKLLKNNGKDMEGNWNPSAFFDVLLPSFLAAKKDTGEPSWLVKKLLEGEQVTLTGELEVSAYNDKTSKATPSLNLVVKDFHHVTLHGGGKAGAGLGDAAEGEDAPFLCGAPF
jgi:hypothetical protein